VCCSSSTTSIRSPTIWSSISASWASNSACFATTRSPRNRRSPSIPIASCSRRGHVPREAGVTLDIIRPLPGRNPSSASSRPPVDRPFFRRPRRPAGRLMPWQDLAHSAPGHRRLPGPAFSIPGDPLSFAARRARLAADCLEITAETAEGEIWDCGTRPFPSGAAIHPNPSHRARDEPSAEFLVA